MEGEDVETYQDGKENRRRDLCLAASISERNETKSLGGGRGWGGWRGLKEKVSNSDCGELGREATGDELLHCRDSCASGRHLPAASHGN